MCAKIAVVAAAVLGSLSSPVAAETLVLAGRAGFLGEWALRADLEAAPGTRRYAGDYALTHTGDCTVGDPETKRGTIELTRPAGRGPVTIRLVYEGARCSAVSRLSPDESGTLACDGGLQVPITLWAGK